uniref:Inositol 1,4,5-triphosphate receptor associated 2 n=1 Tax=Chelonoidis abingdonii TaxID=106734 RepID=A0A8C0GA19_CHEAB
MMSSENVTNKRHHNPVDSICRKIKTIQMMDQVSNPALQIPKFQSRNFDSPQTNIKKNLEEILKKRTFKSHEATGPYFLSPSSDNIFSPCPQAAGHRRCKSDFPTGNATYSIGKNKEKTRKPWLPICQIESSPPLLKSEEANIHMGQLSAASNVKCKDLTCKDNYLTSSPNLPFLTTVQKAECFACQSPVVKRLSLSERGWRLSWANNADNTYDVSLICEEDLLTTIFCACDTERRGKVAVSKIVDYLRHTTSRGSEDSGLEELCNMLDPDKRDISMDLETYHAIMKEWIDDSKKTPTRINITSGSLEALGGDVSKGDLETSDLITCVADLQFKNQKLQEENCKLKMTIEALEDTNNRLMEDNEDLNHQVKSAQQTVMRAKSLKEELEEMKISLNISEEKRCNIVTQHKQLVGLLIIYKSKKLYGGNELPTIIKSGNYVPLIWLVVHVALEIKLLCCLLLEEKINHWIKKLHLLKEHRESLDKEYVRMAGNLRRIKTEQLHFRKELSSRQHELQAAKKLQEEAVSRADVLGLQLQEATKQLEDSRKQVKDQDGALHSAWEEVRSLQSVLEEAISEQRTLQAMNTALMSSCQTLQEKDKEQTSKYLSGQGTGLPKTPSLRYSCWYSTTLLGKICWLLFYGFLPSFVPWSFEVHKSLVDDLKLLSKAEFLRLSLGFKCDLFTLDKRVRLEERSRDLAEENLKKEIVNGLKLLESLAPLCDEDNQAQEIIKKLQKSLQFLSQYAARLASRAEMLGAINQESRVSKAVEVMIQHVENLKRMYTKEHAELEELKEVLLQNERCFHSFGDQGNLCMFGRGRLGSKQNEKRPSLRRFISTYSWTESEEEQSETKTKQSEPPVEEIQEDKARKLSVTERGKNPSKWTLGSACNIMSSWASHLKTSFSKANKTLWISLTIIVLLAALTSFLTGLSLQRPADAAPVGTGSSWTSLQQLLWPYTELQHNGPPPV